jgi:aspartyl protease family protein
MAADGHFWADSTINGVRRRMLIDSGATITAISESTAAAAGVEGSAGPVPVVLKTANGLAPARAASVGELRLGNILARDLKVVVSPAFGDMEVIGMNFLSKLASWRVEGRTLILVPHHPQPHPAGRGAQR